MWYGVCGLRVLAHSEEDHIECNAILIGLSRYTVLYFGCISMGDLGTRLRCYCFIAVSGAAALGLDSAFGMGAVEMIPSMCRQASITGSAARGFRPCCGHGKVATKAVGFGSAVDSHGRTSLAGV